MPARLNPPLIAARTFEAAARHGNFQKAALELNVTPAAVSHQVRKLEEYLGRDLFIRHNRAVQLTAEGAQLAAMLGGMFSELERALDPRTPVPVQAPVHVSAMPSLAAKWLAPRIADFEAQHPQIRVELIDEDALADFRDGRTDLALRYGQGGYAGMRCLPWMAAPVAAVCSPALAAQLREPADLRGQTLIHDETPRLKGNPPDWTDWLAHAGVVHDASLQGPRFSSVYVALEAARAGRGVALAAHPFVADDLASGALVRPFELALENPCAFWIVHPERMEPDARIRTLVNWLLAAANTSQA